MDGALVVILALVWALVILPGALRGRRSSPVSSVGTFERAMDVLARRDTPRSRDGRVVYVPRDAARLAGDRARRRNHVIGRRRSVFLRLLAATAVSLVPALMLGGWLWLLFAVTLIAFVAYVAMLRRWKLEAIQAAMVVRHLPDLERARDVAAAPRELVVGAGNELYGGRHGGSPSSWQVAARPDEPWQPSTSVRLRRFDG